MQVARAYASNGPARRRRRTSIAAAYPSTNRIESSGCPLRIQICARTGRFCGRWVARRAVVVMAKLMSLVSRARGPPARARVRSRWARRGSGSCGRSDGEFCFLRGGGAGIALGAWLTPFLRRRRCTLPSGREQIRRAGGALRGLARGPSRPRSVKISRADQAPLLWRWWCERIAGRSMRRPSRPVANRDRPGPRAVHSRCPVSLTLVPLLGVVPGLRRTPSTLRVSAQLVPSRTATGFFTTLVEELRRIPGVADSPRAPPP